MMYPCIDGARERASQRCVPRGAQPRLVPWRLAWALVLGPGGRNRGSVLRGHFGQTCRQSLRYQATFPPVAAKHSLRSRAQANPPATARRK